MAGRGGYTHGKRKQDSAAPKQATELRRPADICPSCRGRGEAVELLEDMAEISALVKAGFGEREVKTRTVPCPDCKGSGFRMK